MLVTFAADPVGAVGAWLEASRHLLRGVWSLCLSGLFFVVVCAFRPAQRVWRGGPIGDFREALSPRYQGLVHESAYSYAVLRWYARVVERFRVG